MRNHFGLTGRSRSEIYHHRIVQRGLFAFGKLQNVGILFPFFVNIQEVHAFSYRKFIFQSRAFPGGFLDVFYNFVFVYSDDSLNGGAVYAVSYVFYRQKVRRGHQHKSQFAASHIDDIVFVSAIQHRHYEIALFQSHRAEHIRDAVGKLGKFAESQYLFFAAVVAPYDGALFRDKPRVFVHHVVTEIEFGNAFIAKILEIIVIVGKIAPDS